jgi:hypothetical protein
MPAAMSAVDAARLQPIAMPVIGDHDRGRLVTGSASVPMMQQRPTAAQIAPGREPAARRRAVAAAITAAAGIGQGAATPAPQPASRPAVMDSGMLIPRGWPGS